MRTVNQSTDSNETDLSDVGLCSLNIHEHTYNLVLCLLKIGTTESLEEAYNKLTFLLETVPNWYSSKIWILRGVIASTLGE